MYLLVAFNLMLDTLMGCSSGGIRVRDPDTPSASRMLHYRTLGEFAMPCGGYPI